MKNTIIIYFSSLFLSALFTLYAYTGLFMLSASKFGGYYLTILRSFSPLFHFAVSTWLFLFFPKPGSLIGAISSLGMIIGPFLTFWLVLMDNFEQGNYNTFGLLFVLLILILNVYLIFKFLENFKKPGNIPFEYKFGLTSIPFIIILAILVFTQGYLKKIMELLVIYK